ncbi:MAG: hydrogen gas-evolving membrane-bound hydrogenase subunit E [Bacillota bacterium]|jgi:multisubunit Na+/H+ antiporter MnhB subunit
MRLVLTSVIILLIGAVLVQMVAEMPSFGKAGPAINEVTRHYQGKSVEETGATNIITAIILDYRAYDTLGEATVLFAGIAAVLATLTSHGGKREG